MERSERKLVFFCYNTRYSDIWEIRCDEIMRASLPFPPRLVDECTAGRQMQSPIARWFLSGSIPIHRISGIGLRRARLHPSHKCNQVFANGKRNMRNDATVYSLLKMQGFTIFTNLEIWNRWSLVSFLRDCSPFFVELFTILCTFYRHKHNQRALLISWSAGCGRSHPLRLDGLSRRAVTSGLRVQMSGAHTRPSGYYFAFRKSFML